MAKFGIVNEDSVTKEVVWCDTYNFVMLSKDRPLLPEKRQVYRSVIGKDGNYDFSDGTFEDRTIEVDVTFYTGSVGDLRYTARRAAQWLYNKGRRLKLVFDDEPDVYYDCCLANQVSIEQVFTFGAFTLQFRAYPIAIALEYAKDLYELNSPTILHRPIRLEDDDFIFEEVASNSYITVNNYGTAPVRPIMKVTNFNGDYFRFNVGDKFIKVETAAVGNGTGPIYYVDCERYQVYYYLSSASTTKVNMLNKTTGDFFELEPTAIRQYDYDTKGRRYYYNIKIEGTISGGNTSVTVPAIGGAVTYTVYAQQAVPTTIVADTEAFLAQRLADKINTTTNTTHTAFVNGNDLVVIAKNTVGIIEGTASGTSASTYITIEASETEDTNYNNIQVVYVNPDGETAKPTVEVIFQARFY